jgi:hypothetical protein
MKAKPNSKNRESKPRSSPLRGITGTELRSRKHVLARGKNQGPPAHGATAGRAAHARQARAEDIDLSRLHRLREMKEFIEKFLGDELPSNLECADAARAAYKRADALLEYSADAAEFSNEAGTRTEAIEGLVVDSIKLQLEQLYVADMRLQDIHWRALASVEEQSAA